MSYIPIFDHTQMIMCPWDSFVDFENITRLIDVFVRMTESRRENYKQIRQWSL